METGGGDSRGDREGLTQLTWEGCHPSVGLCISRAELRILVGAWLIELVQGVMEIYMLKS